MTKQEVIQIIEKYQDRNGSAREDAMLESWLVSYLKRERVTDYPKDFDYRQAKSLSKILEGSQVLRPQQNSVTKLWVKVTLVAASLILITSIGLRIWVAGQRDSQLVLINGHDITAGKNGATLTLADGKVIKLSDAKKGIKIDLTSLRYDDNTAIEGLRDKSPKKSFGSEVNAPLQSSSIIAATARGQTYTLILPDGTKVWLNAASSLKIPVSFEKSKWREVFLIGEAYFQVQHNSSQPFIVKTENQLVQDIGTEFNINAYADEEIVKTTLVVGSAMVRSGKPPHELKSANINEIDEKAVILKPKQQSILNNNLLTVKNVEPSEAIAWKDGYFKFKDITIEQIMQQISRWYNVEVVYVGKHKNTLFSGRISRSKDISKVLEIIASAQLLHFEIEGRRIKVMQ